MSRTYHIYLDILDSQSIYKMLGGIRFWVCPVSTQGKSSIMFYTKRDVESALRILAKNGIKVYRRVSVAFNSYKYDEVDLSDYLSK